MNTLQSFVPYSGNSLIAEFVPKNRESQTDLMKHYFDLANGVTIMQEYLANHTVWQEILDLYILVAVWLLTYDKVKVSVIRNRLF
jgi:hypothetical protein